MLLLSLKCEMSHRVTKWLTRGLKLQGIHYPIFFFPEEVFVRSDAGHLSSWNYSLAKWNYVGATWNWTYTLNNWIEIERIDFVKKKKQR